MNLFKTTRLKLLSLIVVIAAISLAACDGCSTFGLTKDATPAQRYYAALAAYNQVKLVAAAYAELPDTPTGQVDAIAKVVLATDAKVKAFEEARKAGAITDGKYDLIAATLEFAVAQLRAYVVPEQPQTSLKCSPRAGNACTLEAGVDPATVLLILQIISALAAAVRLTPELKARHDAYVAKVKQLIAEGRGPTDEELAELLTEGDSITERILAAQEAKHSGALSEPLHEGPQEG